MFKERYMPNFFGWSGLQAGVTKEMLQKQQRDQDIDSKLQAGVTKEMLQKQQRDRDLDSNELVLEKVNKYRKRHQELNELLEEEGQEHITFTQYLLIRGDHV